MAISCWFFSLLFYNHVFLVTCIFDWMLNIRDDLKPWMVFLPQRRFKCAFCKLLGHCEVYIALIQTKMGFSALELLFICSLPVSLGCSPLGWQPKPGVFSYTKEVLNCNFLLASLKSLVCQFFAYLLNVSASSPRVISSLLFVLFLSCSCNSS